MLALITFLNYILLFCAVLYVFLVRLLKCKTHQGRALRSSLGYKCCCMCQRFMLYTRKKHSIFTHTGPTPNLIILSQYNLGLRCVTGAKSTTLPIGPYGRIRSTLLLCERNAYLGSKHHESVMTWAHWNDTGAAHSCTGFYGTLYLSVCCEAKGMKDAKWCSEIYEAAAFMGKRRTGLPEKKIYIVWFSALTALSILAGIVMALWVSM